MQTENRKAATTVVYAALAGNLAIAIAKFAAAAFTGSAALFSEGIHSVVDTGNELLLMYGLHRARIAPDRGHPFGYGRELYFWSFLVTLHIFVLGACAAIYEGWSHIREPRPLDRLPVVYAVIGVSMLFEGASWRIAWREFRRDMAGGDVFRAFRRSKDPSVFTVLVEDSAALIGLLLALLGTSAAHFLHRPALDGAASLAIGALLATTAILLARETKGLLIGESAYPRVQRGIEDIAAADPAVARVHEVVTIQLAPDQIIAALDVQFAPLLDAPAIAAGFARIESRVMRDYPEVQRLFVRPQPGR
jgi:cation diffusion facilitator family transporter